MTDRIQSRPQTPDAEMCGPTLRAKVLRPVLPEVDEQVRAGLHPNEGRALAHLAPSMLRRSYPARTDYPPAKLPPTREAFDAALVEAGEAHHAR